MLRFSVKGLFYFVLFQDVIQRVACCAWQLDESVSHGLESSLVVHSVKLVLDDGSMMIPPCPLSNQPCLVVLRGGGI